MNETVLEKIVLGQKKICWYCFFDSRELWKVDVLGDK